MDRPKIKDKDANAYADFLEKELSTYTTSPYVNSYISIKRLIDRGNETIAKVTAGSEVDFDSPVFNAIEKFLSKQRGYYEQLDYFRSKMTDSQRQELGERLLGEGSVVEKFVFNSK